MFADVIIVADWLASAPSYQPSPPPTLIKEPVTCSLTCRLSWFANNSCTLQMVMSGPRQGKCLVPHHTARKWGWGADLGMARDFLVELWTFREAWLRAV